MRQFTHGSLFSGSGGFDEGARRNGITSLWCSEIEPFPIRVLRKNFPNAKQLGDVSMVRGDKIAPVDVISGGSPCQDMSVAGKRAGLTGSRSVLFYEQIRIVKEMREKTNGRYPRFMVWENVKGAFSSNKGEDFRCVLEEIANVAGKGISISRPKKWAHAGCILGDGWSIAWRLFDAQYWGVPQRRQRIYLVADFRGESALEILFKPESVSGNIEASGGERQGIAEDVERGIGKTSRAISFQERAGKPGGGKGILIQDEHVGALSTLNNQSVVYGISAYDSNAMKSSNPHSGVYEASTARTLDLNGGSPACNQGGMAVVQGIDAYSGIVTGDVACTITSQTGSSATHSGPSVFCLEGNGQRPSHQGDGWHEGDPMYTLNGTEHHAVAVENHPADSRVKISEDGIVQTLSSRMGTGGGNVPMVMEQQTFSDISAARCAQDGRGAVHSQMMSNPEENFVLESVCVGNSQFAQARVQDQVAKGPGAVCQSVVRRLTPLECARLQGFPDGWCDNLITTSDDDVKFFLDVWFRYWTITRGSKNPKTENQVRKWLANKPSDSGVYKMWGNGVALPNVEYIFSGIRRILEND